MPYISPSLSPTRTFASPTNSGASSPGRSGSYSGNSTISYVDGYPTSSTSSSSSMNDLASSSIPPSKAAPHRHHSRSHSSDTLVTMSNMSIPSTSSSSSSSTTRPSLYNRHSKNSKMTPEYIFVQPASPGPDELPPSISSRTSQTPSSSHSAENVNSDGQDGAYYHSMPSSSSRQYSYSHQQQQPSSSSSSSASANPTPSSSRPAVRRSSYNRQTASAVFNDYHAYSHHHHNHNYNNGPTSPSMSSTAGDEGDVPPPRSASSSNLSSHHSHASASSQRRHGNRRAFSASADSSPRHSISFTPLPRISDDDQSPDHEPQQQRVNGSSSSSTASSAPNTPGHHARFAQSTAMQNSLSDSALASSSSSSSANSSINNTPEEGNSESETQEANNQMMNALLNSPLLQKHKPSWGEIPIPTSMNGSTSFSFGQNPTPSSTSPSSQAHSSSLNGVSATMTMTNGSGSEENGVDYASSGSSTPRAGIDYKDSPTSIRVAELQQDFVEAQPSAKLHGGLMVDSPTSGSGSSSPSTSGSGGSATNSSSSNSNSTPTPTSGPLAPAATTVKRRPHHMKAFSERAESPFRLEFESNNKPHQHHHSTHSRMTGLRQREASTEGVNEEIGGGAGLPHFAHGGLTVHTHHPIPPALRDHYHSSSHGSHGPRSSSYRPSPLPTPMLRKKSGELVKSSMKHDSRAKSAPTTPTGPKAVHFDEQLERVKLFLAQQKPTAVSRDGSPVETETEDDSEAVAFPFPPMTTSIPAQITLVLPDFNKNMLPDLGNRDVCLESLEIAGDSKSLKGTALLRNLAFEKRLSIRFTFDDWQTVSEVTGEWQATLNGGQIDRWSFRIKLDDMLARIEDKKLYLALKYTVAGREIWDSNNGNNYRAEFKKQAARSQAVVGGSRAARHEWAVTNAGQANERMADLRRELDRLVAGHEDDDFSSADELVISANLAANNNNGNSGAGMVGNGAKGYKYQHRFLGGEAVPLAQAPASNTFSSRYDFGASLKKAAASGSSPSTITSNLPSLSTSSSSTIPLAPSSTGNNSANTAQLLLPQQQQQQQQRGSPQSSHAILDNPYFAAPNASEAMINSWRNAANLLSPLPPSQHSSSTLAPAPSPLSLGSTINPIDMISPQSQQHQRLYADDDAPPLRLTTSVIGGMPATTFMPATSDPSATTPPASFSGSSYYPRTEADGVVSQDFGLPNLLSYMGIGSGANLGGAAGQVHNRERSNSNASSPRTEVPSSASSTASTATPGSYFPAGDPISSSTNSSASNSTAPSVEHSPTTDFSGGAPLMRAGRLVSFPPVRSFLRDVENASPPSSVNGHSFRPNGQQLDHHKYGAGANKSGMHLLHHGQRQSSGSSLAEMLDASLMDPSIDPRDTSIYSPAISPRSTSPPISSSAEIPGAHQRRHSPPPRPLSPDDLLSPSPSSASTDTSISTPQSPGGSPPLRMYSPFIASANGGGGRPEMGSDTYFNFVHRYCWGNGDPASSSSSSSSTSTALGLAGLNPAYELPTPRRITPPSSCSASLLSSPTQSQSGSRTPSPKNGSPSLESVQRMEAKGYMSGPPPVHI